MKSELQATHFFQHVTAATGSRKTSVSSMSSASSGDSSGQIEHERLSAREAQEVRWGGWFGGRRGGWSGGRGEDVRGK